MPDCTFPDCVLQVVAKCRWSAKVCVPSGECQQGNVIYRHRFTGGGHHHQTEAAHV